MNYRPPTPEGLKPKEFYNKGPFGRFKRLEDRGDFTKLQKPLISALCKSLVKTAESIKEHAQFRDLLSSLVGIRA